MQEAKLGEAHREQPRRKPETADTNLLRHGLAPRFGLLATQSLGVDVRLEHELDVTGQRAPIRLRQAVQLFPETWFDSEAERHAPQFAAASS